MNSSMLGSGCFLLDRVEYKVDERVVLDVDRVEATDFVPLRAT